MYQRRGVGSRVGAGVNETSGCVLIDWPSYQTDHLIDRVALRDASLFCIIFAIY